MTTEINYENLWDCLTLDPNLPHEGEDENGRRKDFPTGTVFFSAPTGYHGNRPTGYAITPQGTVYDTSYRNMTHGGLSPWKVIGKISEDEI